MKMQALAPRIYAPLLAAQLAVLAFEPPRVLSLSYAFVLATLAFTLLLSLRRVRLSLPHNRPLWALLLAALLSQAAAFVLLFADSLVNPQGTLVAFDPTFYFCMGSLLLTLAATYDPVLPTYRWTAWVDAALAILIALMFYGLVRALVAGAEAQPDNARAIVWLFDGMALFVAIFATLRLLGARRRDERRFFVVLTAFAWIELFVPAAHNRFVLSSESYVPELLLSLPFAAIGLLLSRRRGDWLRGYRPPARVRHLAGSVSPFVLSLALCLLAFAYLHRNPVLAACAVIAGIASYALRAALMLGRHLSSEDELKRLHHGLRRAALRDDLTQLLNRRGFYRAFDREWERAQRTRTPLAVAMLDIDHFKAFNDTYGHLAGDQCLASVAQALAGEAAAMTGVTLARAGGEEFVVLMSGHMPHAAGALLEKLRGRVEALRILHVRGVRGFVTVSAGIASSELARYEDGEEMLGAADKALYTAKRAGRNQVVWAEVPGTEAMS
ncbi:GGDEF domain-containing protein [Dyella sp. LX-66]|uniref:GGDEF domain-containing protein n=1 Tax=unclassified Dyella TaxID=2634549 RepID=UPI001BE0453E|nr:MULTISPECIES: GGDEF domain-containing protein [unclassified Dyella]MBT2119610.1 GGDEF domain-containing protein [Dyella sp. LX-1]MBT2141960.1 GGDEF domain-containing protein [Dyella sp. LX-66]